MLGDWLEGLRGADGNVDFLQPEYMRRAGRAARLPEPVVQALADGAAEIGEDVRLAELAWQFHRELFVDKANAGEVNKRLLASGPRSGMLAAVVYMGALPQMIDRYRERGISERVWAGTLSDMAIWMERYKSLKGEWGLGQVGWLIHHMSARLFRLGRLQFIFAEYNRPFLAFRRRTGEDVAVLCEPGVRFRADGQADGTNGIEDPVNGWISSYSFDGVSHTGNPVHPRGAAVRKTLSLPAAEWEIALRRGDSVLDVHIPEGEKLTHELCRDSYGQAVRFAQDHFPEKTFRAFVCSSWLLSPQWPELLSPDSNIVRFLSDYYIIPVKSDESQTLERVFGFGTTLADLPRAPRDTRLQRIVFDYLNAGGRIHGAAGFILKDDWHRGTVAAGETAADGELRG
jgi:hypothetical protein